MSAESRSGPTVCTFKYEKGLLKGHIRNSEKTLGLRKVLSAPFVGCQSKYEKLQAGSHFFFLVFPRLIVVDVNRLGGGCSEAISLSCSYFEIACELNTGS